jgi:alanyl-tRNA synthetase
MNTKQIKECEEICKNIVNKKMSVFASNSSLAAAKDIQGLRAIFDEVSQML